MSEANKPFYKRTWFIAVAVVFVLYIMARGDAEEGSPSSPAVAEEQLTPLTAEEKAAQDKVKYLEQVEREIASVSDGVALMTESIDGITLTIALFASYGQIVYNARDHDLAAEELARVDELKRLAIAEQRKALPILRDKYGPLAAQAGWENNIEVRTVGRGYRTIQVTAGMFANNANIKVFQEQLSDLYRMLRFTRSEYRWYEGASKYTYYTMEPHGDDVLLRPLADGFLPV